MCIVVNSCNFHHLHHLQSLHKQFHAWSILLSLKMGHYLPPSKKQTKDNYDKSSNSQLRGVPYALRTTNRCQTCRGISLQAGDALRSWGKVIVLPTVQPHTDSKTQHGTWNHALDTATYAYVCSRIYVSVYRHIMTFNDAYIYIYNMCVMDQNPMVPWFSHQISWCL